MTSRRSFLTALGAGYALANNTWAQAQRATRPAGLFFTAEKVETYTQATSCDVAAFNRFFHAMLERGVYLAPSAFEAGFMSNAHSDDDIAATLDAARAAFKKAS